MGDFLLSILGFNEDNNLCYTRHVSGSHFNEGDEVSISYPNPNRVPLVGYYRIYGQAYSTEVIRKLIDTQDANLIDRDLVISPMHKHHRDKEIFMAAAMGRNVRVLAKQYGWHHGAISLAVERYQAWQNASPDYAVWDKHNPPVITITPEQEEKAKKIALLMSDWDDTPQDPQLVPQAQHQPMRYVDIDENGNECFIDDEGNRTPIDS
jgi:hypothetical protein